MDFALKFGELHRFTRKVCFYKLFFELFYFHWNLILCLWTRSITKEAAVEWLAAKPPALSLSLVSNWHVHCVKLNIIFPTLQIFMIVISDKLCVCCTYRYEEALCVCLRRKQWILSGCIAENVFPPVFGRRLRADTVEVGKRVALEVEVTGTPDPDITWYKDGNQIAGSSSMYRILAQGSCHRLIMEHGQL